MLNKKKNTMLNKIVFFTGLIIGLSSCAANPNIVYKEVKVPVSCQVEIPERPAMTDDTVKNTIELITFTKDLEELLKVCVEK